MGYLGRLIKKLFFWGYARNTWQYDVLCALILAFIFLTPQRWFDGGAAMKYWSNGEPVTSAGHQKPVATMVILPIGADFSAQMTQNEIQNGVRVLTRRPDAQVLKVSPRRDESGKIVAFEVDIE
jgi:hypothetical protein